MIINKYPDGSSYVKLELPDNIAINWKLNSYEDLWNLNQYVDAQNSIGNVPLITIPCLIDSQADRRFNDGESSGLKLVCQFLNKMNANFRIFHPHNPELVEALMDNVEIIDNTYFIKEVLSTIYCNNTITLRDEGLFYHQKDELYDNLILMSSDAGGFKPLMKLCDKLDWRGETASASKARRYEDGKTTLHQIVPIKDFDGKDIIIIDDICVYGGTFKGLSKLLKSRNCGKLYLAVSHITVQNLGEDPVTNYFDKVFATNSKYDEYLADGLTSIKGFINDRQPRNLEIIKMF
jgi:ribose-phosphate pyrophosphokinase